MKLALMETAFAARLFSPLLKELRQSVPVDCLVTDHRLQPQFQYYGLQPLVLEPAAAEVAKLTSADAADQVRDLCQRFGLPGLRQLGAADQAYRTKSIYVTYSEADLFRRAAAFYRAASAYLDQAKPAFVLQNLGAELERRLMRMACDERGIPTIVFDYIPFFKGYQPAKNEHSDLYEVPLRTVSSETVSRYFDDYRQGRSVYYQVQWAPGKLSDRWRRFVEDPERLSLLGKTVKGHAARAYRSAKKRAVETVLGGMLPPPPKDRRVILFPLQTNEESTITVRSHGFCDQVQLIRLLSLCLPDGCCLLVKFHPHYLGGVPLAEVRALAKLQDVYLLQSKVRARDLLGDVHGVVTVNSTVGFEAVLMDKPVLLLGKAIYGGHGVTLDSPTPRDWPAALAQMATFRPDRTKTAALVASWLARGFRGLFNDGAGELAADILSFCVKLQESQELRTGHPG